jgi:ribosomal protein S18 acetylase RimI-like enzyme
MIGDVNLFLYPDSDSDNQDEDDPPDPSNQKEQEQEQQVVGEVEIMIAKKSEQGKGMGKKILLTFLWFIVSSLEGVMGEYHATHGDGKTGSSLKYLRVKIDHENTRSIRLFSSVGFQTVSESPNYFGELELRLPICAGLKEEVEGRMDAIPFIVGYS